MDRNWVWAEMADAWMRQKRDIGVLHGLTLGKIERDRGGLASLAPTNILALDAFDGDIEELKERVIANSPG